MGFSRRQERLRDALSRSGQKAFLISSVNDILYYTGYRSSGSAMLVVAPKTIRLFVSRLEGDAKKLRTAEVLVTDKKSGLLSKELKKHGHVGFDEEGLNAGTYLSLRKAVKLKPAAKWIKEPRQIKEAGEIELMAKAARLTKKAFRMRLAGRPENSIANAVKMEFLLRGDGLAFPPIVAAGKNSAVIHHNPGQSRISRNHLVIMDIGAKVSGYCADFTRTFCSRPGKRERELIENVQNIHDIVLDKAQAGVKYSVLQETFEKEMKRLGYVVRHAIGHGIGLDVHEPAPEVLQNNSTVTIEPGIYIENFGGCRIENTILIKKSRGRVL